jgi:hypothetical protein
MGSGRPAMPEPEPDDVAEIAELRVEVDRLLALVDVLIARRESSRRRPPARPGAA